MNYYVYRYQSFTDGKPTTHCHFYSDERFMEILKSEGSCTRYARHLHSGSTRVKPRNVFTIPSSHWPKRDPQALTYTSYYKRIEDLLSLIATIPWTVDLSAISVDDYPEFFV